MEYANGKIYKLVCDDGHFYFGSTRSTLAKRFYSHKKKAEKDVNRKVYKHLNSIGWDNVKIVLVDEYPCESKLQLTKRENDFIEAELKNEMCLNYKRAYVDRRVAKREAVERTLAWRASPENVLRSRVTRKKHYHASMSLCSCGAYVSSPYKSRHDLTAKHLAAA